MHLSQNGTGLRIAIAESSQMRPDQTQKIQTQKIADFARSVI
jgi:hypothetical protein